MDKSNEADDVLSLQQEIMIITSHRDPCLHRDHGSGDSESLQQLTDALINGRLDQVLGSKQAKTLLNVQHVDQQLKKCKLSILLERLVQGYLDGSSQESKGYRQRSLFLIGIASLQVFIQGNWTGPQMSFSLLQCLNADLEGDKELLQHMHDLAIDELSLPDSNMYPLVAVPEFLLLAKIILVDMVTEISSCLTSCWWAIRCLWIWQQVLDERAPVIFDQIMPLIQKVSSNDVLMCKERHHSLCMTFDLECSHILQYYYNYKASREHLQSAEKVAGLNISLTGAMGKRTKFQHKNLPQLLLKVEKEATRPEVTAGSEVMASHNAEVVDLYKAFRRLVEWCLLIMDLALDDDTLLNSIKLEDPDEGHIPTLSIVEQALVLAMGIERKRSMPKQELLFEEIHAYITGVLSKPQTWCAQMSALMMRCQLEKDRRRTVERAMMQMQSLVDQWRDTTCPVSDRFKLFYAINLPPKWEMEKLLANLFASLGSTSAALEIYIRLHLWEDAVNCYQRLEKPEKAERLIKDQLVIKETPLMLCLLGDVTNDAQHYQRAWEVSNQRSSRAMKSLGLLHVHEKEYEQAIECLEKSIEKNYLQYNAWFLLGYAAIQSEKYPIAVRAYQRCVNMDPDNAEAWNNLSSAFINLKDKSKAFKTLQEALKCNYENYKIWENFMWTSIDIGEFSEGIKAYNRLMELREKYIDEEVLGILVKSVTSEGSDGIKDAKGRSAQVYKKKVIELFGHLTSQVTNNAQIWSLYGRLHGNGESQDSQANDKALQCLQKAHRLKVQSPDWIKEIPTCKEIMEQSIQLAQVYVRCSESKTNTGESIQLLSSAKLMMKSTYTKCKQQQQEMVVFAPTWSELDELLNEMESLLQTITDDISQLKGQS